MKPNILFIFSDQHRPHAMSCYGDPNIETPNLDRLAEEGVLFTNAYSTCPVCAPFRACLYTGQYINTHGVTSLFKPLLPNQPVLAEVLRDAGYHTSHMGKWHLAGGDCPSHFVSPYFRPGWDEWLGWENSNHPWATEYGIGPMPHPYLTMEKYQTDGLTDFTVEWLKKQAERQESGNGGATGERREEMESTETTDGRKPWFHVVSIEPPHPGAPKHDDSRVYDTTEPYMEMFKEKPLQFQPNFDREHPDAAQFEENLRGYYAQIKNLDDNAGRIIEALAETGQLENTIVLYFADHGDMMGSHGMRQKSRPEEESSRIPLIIRLPQSMRRSEGVVSNALFGAVDIMPTMLGLIGVPIPDSVQGEDLSEVITGQRTEGPESLLIQFERNFFDFAEEERWCFRALRRDRWKYVVYLTEGPCALYDLEADPYEMENLIDSTGHGDVRAELDREIRRKCAEIDDDFFTRLDARGR
jgi:arylsulfatase A-like enzyme